MDDNHLLVSYVLKHIKQYPEIGLCIDSLEDCIASLIVIKHEHPTLDIREAMEALNTHCEHFLDALTVKE